MTREEYDVLPDQQREVMKQIFLGQADNKDNTMAGICDRVYYPNMDIVRTLDTLEKGGQILATEEKPRRYSLAPGTLAFFQQWRKDADQTLNEALRKAKDKLKGLNPDNTDE